jgi:hypothetical protein
MPRQSSDESRPTIPKLLKVPEVAEILGPKKSAVYAKAARGEIGSLYVGQEGSRSQLRICCC